VQPRALVRPQHHGHLGVGIPASLSRTNLSSVSFLRNKLTGRIPTSLQKLPHLTFFDAADNDLVGRIPPRLVHGGTPELPLGLSA